MKISLRQQVSRKAFIPSKSDPTASSSIETIVSTASTIPYVYDKEIDDEIRSNPSTIDLASESDEEVVELYTHFVPAHRRRPPAPFTVISQTNLRDEQVQTNDDATLAQNSDEIEIADNTVVNLDEFEIVEESTHNSDEVQLIEGPKETVPAQFQVVKIIL